MNIATYPASCDATKGFRLVLRKGSGLRLVDNRFRIRTSQAPGPSTIIGGEGPSSWRCVVLLLCRLRRGRERRYQSQDVQVMYARQVLQCQLPEESLVDA